MAAVQSNANGTSAAVVSLINLARELALLSAGNRH